MRLDLFNPKKDFSRGKPFYIFGVWLVVSQLFIDSPWPWPSSLKAIILRLFGAKIGKNVHLKPRLTIHFPWKLRIGDNVWIGQETYLHNMESLIILNNTAIAHRVFITTGSHNFNKISFPYNNKKSIIGKHCWICSCVYIGPGIKIADGTVVYPGSVVTKNTKRWTIVGGNPASIIRTRGVCK